MAPSKSAKSAHKVVVAAGGVVWRARDGAPEVLVAHRPRYDDWSLPKGKLEPDEAELLAAVREVGEEVGARVAVQQRLGTVRYDDDGARKKVTYWAMRYLDGEFEPNEEVDEIAWLRVGRAYRRLTYDLDRSVLSDFASSPAADAVLILVRHARAGKRSDWLDDDRLRPLDPSGQAQARELARLLAAFAPHRVIAADRTRCEQTVQPLADAIGLQLVVDPAFSDEAFDDGPTGTAARLMAQARPGSVSVICSQGYTVPALVDRLGPGLRSPDTRKGAYWVLTVVDGDVVATDHYPSP